MPRSTVLKILTTVAAVLLPAVAQAQAQPSMREDAIAKREVLTAMEAYFTAYEEGDAEWLRERMFTTPFLGLSASGLAPELTQQERNERVERVMRGLADEGWASGGYLDPTICIVNPSTAFVSGTYTRYRADGSILNEHGGTYFFAKADDGWRMVASLSHEIGKRLDCVVE